MLRRRKSQRWKILLVYSFFCLKKLLYVFKSNSYICFILQERVSQYILTSCRRKKERGIKGVALTWKGWKGCSFGCLEFEGQSQNTVIPDAIHSLTFQLWVVRNCFYCLEQITCVKIANQKIPSSSVLIKFESPGGGGGVCLPHNMKYLCLVLSTPKLWTGARGKISCQLEEQSMWTDRYLRFCVMSKERWHIFSYWGIC